MLDENFWAKYFKEYDVLNYLIPYQDLLESLCEELNIKKEDYVLDAGSGTGNLAVKLESCGVNVVALDFSREGQKRHKQKASRKTKFVLSDLTQEIPFSDNYFDKIVSNNTIYSLPKNSRPQVFNEFYRVLKPGGKIVISNVHADFSPFKIYFGHTLKSFKKYGVVKTFKKNIFLLMSTIKIFFYNFKVKKEHEKGDYWFIKKREQGSYLSRAGFESMSEERFVYEGQAIMNSAVKPK